MKYTLAIFGLVLGILSLNFFLRQQPPESSQTGEGPTLEVRTQTADNRTPPKATVTEADLPSLKVPAKKQDASSTKPASPPAESVKFKILKCGQCSGTGIADHGSMETRCMRCEGHGILKRDAFGTTSFVGYEEGSWKNYSKHVPDGYYRTKENPLFPKNADGSFDLSLIHI